MTVVNAPHAERMWTDVADWLSTAGVTTVFALPDDDMVAARALQRAPLTIEWAVSQRTLVHMATGLSLARGEIAVCIVGRGPAVAACVPALLEAQASHAPVLVIATGTSRHRRQRRAFQDAPTLEMVVPVTRWATRVEHADDITSVLDRAFAIMTDGVGGPAYIEIPDDAPAERRGARCTPARAQDLTTALDRAQRPLILVGGGLPRTAGAEVAALADALGAGILSTVSGRGTISEAHPNYLGLSGFYMRPDVSRIVARADLVLTLGSALEETAMTGMPMNAEWMQVNASAQGVNHSIPGRYVLEDLDNFLPSAPERARTAWWATSLAKHAPEGDHLSRCARVLSLLAELLPSSVVVHENGLHDMWSYDTQTWPLPSGSVDVAPSEMTTLGFGAAAALGIAAAGDGPVVAFLGDAAFATILGDLPAFLGRPMRLLFVVFDDGGLGWLNREALRLGAEASYLWSSPLTLLGSLDVVVDLEHADDDGDAVRRAVERASSGQITVLRVPCDPADIPPFLRESEHER